MDHNSSLPPHPPGCLSPGAATSLEAWVSLRGLAASPARWEEAGPSPVALGGRSLVAAGARKGCDWEVTLTLSVPLRVPASSQSAGDRCCDRAAAPPRGGPQVPVPPPAPSTPLPFPPPPPPAATGCQRSRCRVPAELRSARADEWGDTRGPDPGGHPGAPVTRQPASPYSWPATLGPRSSLGGGRVPGDPSQLRARRWRNRSARARTRSPPPPAPSLRTSPPPAAASPTTESSSAPCRGS